MVTPYLIQRAKFADSPNKEGIDRVLTFDYMGSAEFEFGALPESLKRVRKNIADYMQFQYRFKRHPAKEVTVLCQAYQYEFIGTILEQLSRNKLRLKERCDLSEFFNPEQKYSSNDFWWDIENDWFFWKHNLDFTIKFRQALSNK
jgi:hypothetical protein